MRMRGLSVLISGALLVGACGSSSPHGDQPDANTNPADARPAPGTVKDFETCVPASTKPAEMCAGAQSDCLADPSDSSGQSFMCLPKCTTSADCNVSTFCVPDAGGNGGPSFGAIADHCYLAWCGQIANPAVHNGTTGGACEVGGQTGENDIPGWCDPIVDGSYGFCIDVGTVTSGGDCDPNAGRGQPASLCDVTDICISQKNPPANKCHALCDTTKFLLTGDKTGGCTGANENCYDLSTMVTFGTNVETASVGFCDATHAICDVTKTGGCTAESVSGNLWGCVPTTAVRSDGICDPEGAGNIVVGAACDLTTIANGDATQCVEGAMCYQNTGAATGTCYQICSFEAGGTACTAGSCTKITIDAGQDGQLGTFDDQISQTWGICE
jgi:hypothetical protein